MSYRQKVDIKKLKRGGNEAKQARPDPDPPDPPTPARRGAERPGGRFTATAPTDSRPAERQRRTDGGPDRPADPISADSRATRPDRDRATARRSRTLHRGRRRRPTADRQRRSADRDGATAPRSPRQPRRRRTADDPDRHGRRTDGRRTDSGRTDRAGRSHHNKTIYAHARESGRPTRTAERGSPDPPSPKPTPQAKPQDGRSADRQTARRTPPSHDSGAGPGPQDGGTNKQQAEHKQR